MSASRLELVARVGKTRGLDGKVTVFEADGLPFCLSEGLEVHVVPPSMYGPRQLTVDSVAELADGTHVVAFSQVKSIDDAEQIVGRSLLAEADAIDVDWLDAPDYWLGRFVRDERLGDLGTIEEVIETAAHDVWVVRGAYGEVLVPAVDEFVLDIPENDDEPISTAIPDGLV